jgi:23S rRNA (guanosine2251-2'-O)-methyltransferase
LGGEGTVGVTPVVAKASAGAVERIPIARELHLRRRLMALRTAGFRVVALDSRGSSAWDRADLGLPLVVLAGGEAAGLGKGLLETADERVQIPLAHGVESLNVSVAVAVVLFEAVRRGRALGSSVPAP